MDLFEVNITLRIITPSEQRSELMIFVDDNGDFPKIKVRSNRRIDDHIIEKLNELFYENDLYTILSTKQISSIESSSNSIDIFYNFLSTSTESKTGSFVYYNQRSIELFRLANNHSL
jgi:hypothetical protein